MPFWPPLPLIPFLILRVARVHYNNKLDYKNHNDTNSTSSLNHAQAVDSEPPEVYRCFLKHLQVTTT